VELDNILTLSPLLSEKLTKKLIDVIDIELLAADKGMNMVSEGIDAPSVLGGPAWILGACMRALQQRPHTEWTKEINISDWTRKGVKEWGSSPEFLAGLTPLARSRYGVFLSPEAIHRPKVTTF
jgi:hypothetical protein